MNINSGCGIYSNIVGKTPSQATESDAPFAP
jgi:hypothetical protein